MKFLHTKTSTMICVKLYRNRCNDGKTCLAVPDGNYWSAIVENILWQTKTKAWITVKNVIELTKMKNI